ncbi:MAG: DNA primase, partial [Eggerthellaceae bacterium]|nr:DNA primase [Eggerthellaceae bacterium]
MPFSISDEDVQKVREASDLVAVVGERSPVRQKGKDYWCCCPLHNEKTPSFKIDPVTQLWHCFGCGQGGDVFGFVMKLDNLTFPEAVISLADRAHIVIETKEGKSKTNVSSDKKARLKEICAQTSEFYHQALMRSKDLQADKARAYLASRGFGGQVPKKWNLGFAIGNGSLVRYLSSKGYSADEMVQANVALIDSRGKVQDRFFSRVMFPINDVMGDCIAFGGRVIDKGEPKYLNSKETPLFHKSVVLYGLDKAKASITSTGIAVVVEGYTDVIALHEAGLTNVVATLGTALTIQHIRALSRFASKAIVYLFDGDEAGQRAADRALGFIDEQMTPEAGRVRIDLRAVTLPDNLDPAEYVIAKGADSLNKLIEEAKPLIRYGIDRKLAHCDLNSAEGRSRALSEVISVLAPIKNSLLAKDYAIQIAGILRLREDMVLEELAKLKVLTPMRYEEEQASVYEGQTPQLASETSAANTREVSVAEANRRKIEAEFLSLIAQYPEISASFGDTLAQTQWHLPLHQELAALLLDILSSSHEKSGAQVVSLCASKLPASSGLLTSADAGGIDHAQAVCKSLGFDLSIGDLENAIADLKSMLENNHSLSSDD